MRISKENPCRLSKKNSRSLSSLSAENPTAMIVANMILRAWETSSVPLQFERAAQNIISNICTRLLQFGPEKGSRKKRYLVDSRMKSQKKKTNRGPSSIAE